MIDAEKVQLALDHVNKNIAYLSAKMGKRNSGYLSRTRTAADYLKKLLVSAELRSTITAIRRYEIDEFKANSKENYVLECEKANGKVLKF